MELVFLGKRLAIHQNDAGEIFVHPKDGTPLLRIKAVAGKLEATAPDGRLVPWARQGEPAFRCEPK